jgi:hypothetical protein
MAQLEQAPGIGKCREATTAVDKDIDALDAQFKKWDAGESAKDGKI